MTCLCCINTAFVQLLWCVDKLQQISSYKLYDKVINFAKPTNSEQHKRRINFAKNLSEIKGIPESGL